MGIKLNITDVNQLELSEVTSTGQINGGVVTPTGGINFSISDGYGYSYNNGEPKKVTWTGISGATLYAGNNFISIDANGVLQVSTSFPNDNEIKLGFIYTDSTNTVILGFSSLANPIANSERIMHNFFRKALRPLVVDGNQVSEKANPNELQLDINNGELFVQGNFITTSQTSVFQKLYNSSDVGFAFDTVSTANEVVTDKWNDITLPTASSLVTMTTNYFKKDMIVRVPSGLVFYIYGTSEWATEIEALEAPLPTIPDSISGGAVKLAHIVVQQGDTAINGGIKDIRPNLARIFDEGVDPSAAVSADHGALTGLLDDDHTQYHNDTRALIWLNSRSTTDLPEGTNEYYTEAKVSANTDVTANTLKVSADGSVTTHSDVTDAGSGAIITSAERLNLGNQSNTNTGDETTSTIQTKRPLKTVNSQSLEGVGNIITPDTDTQLSDAQVETAYNNQVPIGTDAEIATGTETAIRRWSPKELKDAFDTLGGAPQSYEAEGTSYITYGTTAYDTIPNMTITPPAGTYQVIFSTSGNLSMDTSLCLIAIHVDGVIKTSSIRDFFIDDPKQRDMDTALLSTGIVTVNGSQAIDIRWYHSGPGVVTIYERTLNLIKVKP